MADPIVSFRINPPVIRLVIHGFLISTILLLAGCGNSPINSSTSDTSGTPHPSTINLQPSTPSFRLHWLGKKRLSAESNATNFISIWNMPESLRLESQTLDKLSTAPWRLLTTISTLSNAPSALLRPLLNDLIQEESYVEVSASTNVPAEIVLAIKLPADRVALWQTNLPLILNSLQPSTFNVQPLVTNIGNWTILSISDIRLQTSDVRLLSQVRHRLSTTGLPFAPETTNFWISGRVDFSWLSKAFSWNLKSITNLPVCEFSAIGDGTNVRSLATLTFPGKVPIELEPWNVPTNLIYDPLIAFTTFRNVGPLYDWWQNEMPIHALKRADQVVSWAVAGFPFQTYFAIPQFQSTNAIRLISSWLTGKIAIHGESSFPGRLTIDTNFHRVVMEGFPFVIPRLEWAQSSTREYLFGGLIPIMRTNRPMPLELLAQIYTDPNLIYYDWEITGPRVEAWTYIGQTLRLIFSRAQLPPSSLGMAWLKAISPRTGNSVTTISVSATNSLSMIRNSTIGMTGMEAHILADWLESPNFPVGFHTLKSAPMRGLLPAPRKTK